MDVSFCLETLAQRSRYAVAARQQSVSGQAAALHSSAALSISVRAAGRERLVAPRVNQRMVAGIIRRQRTVPSLNGRGALVRLSGFALKPSLFQSRDCFAHHAITEMTLWHAE